MMPDYAQKPQGRSEGSQTPNAPRSLAARLIAAAMLNAASTALGIVLGGKIVEAMKYKGTENYALLFLAVLGAPTVLLQAGLTSVAIVLAMKLTGGPAMRLAKVALIITALIGIAITLGSIVIGSS